MRRVLLASLALAVGASSAWPDQTTTATETLIRLHVQPMPAPSPALRYLLLPDLRELNPGNPIHEYLKCFMEQQTFFFDKDQVAQRDKYGSMPLKDLPATGLQNYGGFALRQADWAARLDRPDWQILLKARQEGADLLLPDLQQLRSLATALKVRFRAEVALGRIDDAIRTAKTMFALSTHLADHPTLIGDLVGIAVATVTIGPLEELLEQPGCPNLYWALTNLPHPLVGMSKGMEGERVLTAAEFRDLDDTAPMSPEQIQKVIARMDRIRQISEGKTKAPEGLRAWLDGRNKDENRLAAARRRLAAFGLAEDRLKRFPPDQILLLDERLEMDVRRDDIAKLMRLPTWEGEALALKLQPPTDSALFEIFIPALDKIRRAQGRLETRIALLRHVEALRMYAAEHDGKLPASLAEVTVPLPPDPFTGKPFLYKAEGNMAHLRSTPPVGLEKEPPYNLHYEVTIGK